MNKNAIKKFAIDARNKLLASVTDKAGMLGITPDNCSEAITKGADFEVYKTAAGTEVTLNKKQCEQRRKLVDQIHARGFEAVVEEVAYTWFNRICAIRFMEVNDYMYPVRVRVLSSEKEGKNEPDVVTMAPDIDWNLTDKEREEIIDAKMNGSQDALFRQLFLKQCNLLHEVLPGLFEGNEDYMEPLLTLSYTDKDGIIYHLIHNIEEDDFNVEKEGQVEIIGWLYQYYISEKHDEIINIYKGTIKKDDIPAATQLFTTDWFVRYMVDNSLGRYWIERNPQSKLAEKLEFYVTPKNGEIQYVDEKISPTDLTFFDPCMGSGHILVYAFDVLMEIYREGGYSDRDAALNIVENNIFGMDIDKRAYQLAYFAVMMKARSYNRRALTQVIKNNLAIAEESNSIDKFECDGLTNNKEKNKIGDYLVKAYKDAREIGTLQTVEKQDYDSFRTYLNDIEKSAGQLNFLSTEWLNGTLPLMFQLTKQAEIMSNKYAVVCTNPPYMNKLEGQLKKFVIDNYKEYSGDLFSVFIQQYIKQNRKWFIPGSIFLDYNFGHHDAYLFPEQKLGNEYAVDYMLLGKNSDGYSIVLVEFEKSDTPYCRSTANIESESVKEGLAQIKDWQRWMLKNQDYFMRNIGLTQKGIDIPIFRIFYYLVVSRRDYMNDIAHDMRSQTMYDMRNLKIVTFDRLEENVRKLANNHSW